MPASLILILIVLANLPWLTERLFVVIPLRGAKAIWLRLLEQLLMYLVGLLVAIAFEMNYSGDIYPQSWEFFVSTFCLFLVLAVPGVVYRFQWIPQQQKYK